MKLKVLSALLASAFAGIATTASAGVIQASYKNYASEVFGTDAVVLTAPTINYALALPLSGTAGNPNTFSMTWTLINGGVWNAAPPAANVVLSDPANANPLPATTVTLSADAKTLTATFTVVTNYTVGSQIVLGAGGPVQLTKVGAILGAPALTNGCGNDIASVSVAVKLTNAAGVEFDSNFTLAPLSNTTPIVQASVALSVTAQDSATFAAPAAGPGPEKGKVDVLQPSLGKFFTNDGDVTLASTALLNIGAINIKDRSVLFDLNGTNAYSSKGPTFGTNPNTGAGVVEANSLTVNVSGPFLTTANGGSFFATPDPSCVAAGTAGTIALDGSTATVTIPNATLVTFAGAVNTAVSPIYLCYKTTNTKVIPTAAFAVTGGSLSKFANSLEAANPVCPGAIYNLRTNGVQVDVRNYVPGLAKTTPGNGWYSVIRVINTDAAQTVSPVVQALLANGTLGASATLTTTPSVDNKTGAFNPLEVRYYTSDKIDQILNAAATPGAPSFGPADVAGNARLRITAPSSSIRVQNYVYNPANGNFFEASAAQGDDGSVNANAPTVADVIRARADGENK